MPFPCGGNPALEDLSADLVDDLRLKVREFVGQPECELRVRGIELVKNAACLAEMALPNEACPDPGGAVPTDRRRRAVVGSPAKPRKGGFIDLAEADARILLEFGLQLPREILVRLVGDDSQPVDRLVVNPLAAFADGQTQSAPDFLSLLLFGSSLWIGFRSGCKSGRRWDCPSLPSARNAKRRIAMRLSDREGAPFRA